MTIIRLSQPSRSETIKPVSAALSERIRNYNQTFVRSGELIGSFEGETFREENSRRGGNRWNRGASETAGRRNVAAIISNFPELSGSNRYGVSRLGSEPPKSRFHLGNEEKMLLGIGVNVTHSESSQFS